MWLLIAFRDNQQISLADSTHSIAYTSLKTNNQNIVQPSIDETMAGSKMAKSTPYKEIVEDRVVPQARLTHWIFSITPLWAWGSMLWCGRQRSALQVAPSMSNFHKTSLKVKKTTLDLPLLNTPLRHLLGFYLCNSAETALQDTGNDSDNITELDNDDSDMYLWFLLMFNLVIHLQTTVLTHSNLFTYLIPNIQYYM